MQRAGRSGSHMSALGQKQTFGPRNSMSALPPESGHWLSMPGCPLSAKSGQSGGSQCAVSVPRYRVVQTVVTPKHLTAYNKAWRSEDVQPLRLVGVLIISAPDRFRICCGDYAIGVLADFAQTF